MTSKVFLMKNNFTSEKNYDKKIKQFMKMDKKL